MPLLPQEPDLFPDNLLEHDWSNFDPPPRWYALYTISRREKALMRKLLEQKIPFYGPTISKRTKFTSGQSRTSYIPLFSNYVFLFGNGSHRHKALETNCISRVFEVPDGDGLKADLRRIRLLINTGAPITVEARLEPGMLVRVTAGTLQGQVGTIVRRQGKDHLVLSVDFLQQGASIVVDNLEVEPVD
jgi:transcription antitermination factor NusG